MSQTPAPNQYDRHVLARLVDFFTLDNLPWPRRLWDVGSLLALEELYEAGSWARQRVLSPAAVDWQRCELLSVIGPDIGLGSKDLRRELTNLLKGSLPDPSPARRRLRELTEHTRPGYMQRWADAAALPQGQCPSAERLARTVAAHLLDLGYEAEYLQRWARELSRSGASAVDVLNSAVDLDGRTLSEFTVLAVLLQTPEQRLAEEQAGWLSAHDVIEWMTERGHSTVGLRLGGGLTFRLTAWDPYGAAAQVRQLLERLVARFSFLRGARDGLKPNATNLRTSGCQPPKDDLCSGW